MSTPQNAPPPFRSGSRGRGRGRYFDKGGKHGYKAGRGSGRSYTKYSGESDAYCMDIAPLNIFENQVVPMGLHNFSKIFKPNIATTRVFSLGMKFIPTWKKVVVKKPFCGFKEFRRRMTNKMFFEETEPGVFVKNKTFMLKKKISGRTKLSKKLTIFVSDLGMVLQTSLKT